MNGITTKGIPSKVPCLWSCFHAHFPLLPTFSPLLLITSWIVLCLALFWGQRNRLEKRQKWGNSRGEQLSAGSERRRHRRSCRMMGPFQAGCMGWSAGGEYAGHSGHSMGCSRQAKAAVSFVGLHRLDLPGFAFSRNGSDFLSLSRLGCELQTLREKLGAPHQSMQMLKLGTGPGKDCGNSQERSLLWVPKYRSCAGKGGLENTWRGNPHMHLPCCGPFAEAWYGMKVDFWSDSWWLFSSLSA